MAKDTFDNDIIQGKTFEHGGHCTTFYIKNTQQINGIFKILACSSSKRSRSKILCMCSNPLEVLEQAF